MSFLAKVSATSKAIVGVFAVLLTALNEALPIVPDEYKHYVTAVIGFLAFVVAFYAKYAPLGSSVAAAGDSGGTATPSA